MIKKWWNSIPIGTRSVLCGAHAFWQHWLFVAIGWIKLYGFPFDPRIWFAFFCHDLGYWGLPNLDGPEGERHVEFGARLMGFFFGIRWYEFCLYHSRHYAKKFNKLPSKLCFADKLAFVYTPRWLYLPLVTLTGEINEFLDNANQKESKYWTPTGYDKKKWHAQLKQHFIDWVNIHKNGEEDTWTSKRHM